MEVDPELKLERLHTSERLVRFGRATLDYVISTLPCFAYMPPQPTTHKLLLEEIDRLETLANDPREHHPEL